jgi:hypothetical protein
MNAPIRLPAAIVDKSKAGRGRGAWTLKSFSAATPGPLAQAA